MGEGCNDTDCSKYKDERITELEKAVDKKIDEKEVSENYQKRISVKWIIGIILTIILGAGGAITTGYNVYSSEYKFAKKDDVTSFKETANIRLISTEKDICSINDKMETLSNNFLETKNELKQQIQKSNDNTKQMLEEHTKHLERLIKSFHRDKDNSNNGG